MRISGLLLAGLFWSLAHQAASFAGDDFTKATVVKVRAYQPHGKVATGSAVLLGAERLVTNCHVTASSQDLEVVHHGRSWRAEVAVQNPLLDLCILNAPGIGGATAKAAKRVSAGQKVFAAGFSGNKQLVVTAGHIVALHDHDGGQVIQVSSPFDPGASGGGLFDEDGRLIGILTFKARIGGAYHFALPADWVNALNRPGTPQGAAETLAFWQQPTEKQPFFLRAMSLEVNQKWQALAALAENWARTSPMNPRAWMTLETALRHLQRLDDALKARGEAQRLRIIQARQEFTDAAPSISPVISDADYAGHFVSAALSGLTP
jgi:hypothetical protein